MSRICRRIPVVAVLAALAATPALASAVSPSSYVLKNAKAHCRSGYRKKTVTITVKRGHRKVKQHQLRCVKKGSSGGSGSGVTFPTGLPTVTVTPTLVPTATGHIYGTTADHTLTVAAPGALAGASGHGLVAQLVSGTPTGTLALHKDGAFTYVPADGASGIVHFTYKVADLNSTTSKPATVTIDVSPTAAGAEYAVNASQTLFVPASQLLAADVGSGLGGTLVSGTAHGSLTLDSTGMSYTPNGGFTGSDSFAYKVVDADGLVSNAVTVTIDVGSVPPSIVPQGFSGAVGNTPLQVGGSRGSGPQVYQPGSSPLLAGDTDPNGGGALAVTPETVTTARGGSVVVAGDGSFTYTPPLGFDGPAPDSFTYGVTTVEGTSATATATIAFAPTPVWYVNDAVAITGNGSAGSPFKTFGEAAAAAHTGDDIYLFRGSSDYAGPVAVPSGVSLVGQGSVLTVDNEALTSAGSAPTVANGSGDGITIAGDGSVSGVNVHNTLGNGVSVTGSGTVTLTAMAITSSTDNGIDASGPTVLSVTNSTVSNSGLAGIVFGGSSAGPHTFIITGDIISGQPGDALSLAGFSGDAQGVILNSTLDSSAGNGVDLADSAGRFLIQAYGDAIGPASSGTGILVNGAGTSQLAVTLDNPTTPSPSTVTAATGVSITGSGTATCLSATSNSVTSTGGGNFAMSLDTGGGTFSIFNGTSPFDTYLAGANTLSGPGGAVSLTGSFTTTGSACSLPQDSHLQ